MDSWARSILANKSKNDINILKSIFIITLSIFLILNLIFATPSQMMMSSLVYATSNNSESAEFTSDGTNSQNEVPGEDKVEVVEEVQNTENDSSNNIPDTNIGLFDSGALDKNILKGKDVSSQSIETAYLKVSTFNGQEIADYFGYQLRDELGETVSVCVDTLVDGGSIVQAIPHCFTKGFNHTELLAVKPGQIIIDIQHSPRITIDDPLDCSIKYLVPKELKECQLSFMPTPIPAEITPKPNSDFGKSMISP